MSATFEDVKLILDALIEGRDPNRIRLAHRNFGGSEADRFGWETEEQLLNAKARGHRLINPEYRGNGQGERTNLVIALTHTTGVDGHGRMPLGGPELDLDSEEIETIIAWINSLPAEEDADKDINEPDSC